MKKLKLVAFFVTVVITFQITLVQASDSKDFKNSDTLIIYNELSDNEKLVYDSMTITENNDWQKWANYFAPDIRDEYIEFVSNPYNEENHVGIYAVNSGSVVDISSVRNGQVTEYYEMSQYLDTYNVVEAYMVGVNYSVSEENDYYFDGINYRLVIIAEINNNWFKVQEANCSHFMLENNANEAFTTDAIDELEYKQRMLVQGSKTLTVEEVKELKQSDTSSFFSSNNTTVKSGVPLNKSVKDIKVKMTRLSGSPIHTVNMITYTKVVLANEVYSSWHYEALYACGLAAKTYGSYRILVPKYPNLGYDVKDTTADQNYNPNGTNVGNSRIVKAVDDYKLWIVTDENSDVICTYYKAGPQGVDPRTVDTPYSPNVSHPKYCGDMSQWGAQYLANNVGWDCLDILDFYYSYSPMSDGSQNRIRFTIFRANYYK